MRRSLVFIISFLLVFIFTACTSQEEVQYDPEAIAQKWICSEVYHNDKKQEIFSGAYVLELHKDNSYKYKAGMFEDNGNWTINKSEILLTNQSGEQKSLEILGINDTALIVQMEQMGGELRMHLITEI